MTRHQYGISALISQTSFCGKPPVASRNVGCFLRLQEPQICKRSLPLRVASSLARGLFPRAWLLPSRSTLPFLLFRVTATYTGRRKLPFDIRDLLIFMLSLCSRFKQIQKKLNKGIFGWQTLYQCKISTNWPSRWPAKKLVIWYISFFVQCISTGWEGEGHYYSDILTRTGRFDTSRFSCVINTCQTSLARSYLTEPGIFAPCLFFFVHTLKLYFKWSKLLCSFAA